MTDFLQRLQQRKLVQWAVAYIAFAFALIQVLDVVAQRFGWSEQVEKILILALAIGFFVVLVLAWYHGERGVQRVNGTELLILALLLAIGGGLLWRFAAAPAGDADAAHRNSTTAPAQAVPIPEKSIAVLPLNNESGEKDQLYFSDGLSEDLINALSQFAGLKVISRNSSFQFRDSRDNSKTIGAKLGVAHLLEGSVQHAGDMVRITAQLVNAADSSTLWSQRYDRPYKDLFALQDDITHQVADALKTKLLQGDAANAQSDRPPGGNLAAYNAYLQGAFDGRRNTAVDLRAAIGFYQEAIRLDPNYALAYASLARSEVALFAVFSVSERERDALLANARTAAATALTLQPDLGRAHQTHAFILQIVDFDLVAAEAEYRRAAELAPQDSGNALSLGIVYATFGRLAEAATFGRKAVALDPLSSINYVYLARTLNALGRYDEAESVLRKALEINPQGAQSYCELAIVQILRGNGAAAVELAQRETDPFWRTFALALAHFANGDHAKADAALNELLGKYNDSGAFQIAQVYALRKEPDKVFEWLDHGFTVRDPGVPTLRYAAFVRGYSADPRFAAFCIKVGLPTTTDAKGVR